MQSRARREQRAAEPPEALRVGERWAEPERVIEPPRLLKKIDRVVAHDAERDEFANNHAALRSVRQLL